MMTKKENTICPPEVIKDNIYGEFRNEESGRINNTLFLYIYIQCIMFFWDLVRIVLLENKKEKSDMISLENKNLYLEKS